MRLFKTINISKFKFRKKEKVIGTISEFKNYKKTKHEKNNSAKISGSVRYLIVRKRVLLFFMAFIFTLSCFAFLPSVFAAATPPGLLTIVIDAGHGGIDAGCSGTVEGSNERELNLKYANTLKKYLEEYGIKVVMTRTTTDGLYSAFATNRKKDDMKKRKEIIEKSSADLIISLHMNSFPLKSARGAHVFYNSESEVSKTLATSIQKSMHASLPFAKKEAGVGDYYMLNCTKVPAIIVECGFLSNAEEEKLILSDDYREKLCYSILCGIIKYLE